MLRFLYGVALRLYVLIVRMVSPWNPKARQWIRGRQGLIRLVRNHFSPEDKIIWFHAASLGEFEQGRPLMEAIREQMPEKKILLTFFSPSGYEVRKNFAIADLVCYLPIDTRRKVGRFVEAVNPEVLFIIKYEFWYNLFAELKQRDVPIYLVSGIFREKQHFFRWWGKWFLKNLDSISWFFVQDKSTFRLLARNGFSNVTITGDTRFDRVTRIAQEAAPLPWLAEWKGNAQVMVAGSTWPQDEMLLRQVMDHFPSLKWLIAPHLVDDAHISHLMKILPKGARKLSQYTADQNAAIIVIDSIGLLSRLYRYATIAYIGGGFGKGIHNLTEAAVYGCPVLFGPNHHIFREAHELIERKGGFAVGDAGVLKDVMTRLLGDAQQSAIAGKAARDYISQGTGATQQILQHLSAQLSR